MIEIDQVSKLYAGSTDKAVDGVTLHVPDGALIAVVGLSGSGKTTLMKIVNRLVEPDSGAVRIEGKPITASEPSDLRRRIGYVFQGAGLFPHFTVAENIAVTPELCGWPAGRIAQRIATLLELVELPQTLADRFPSQLSGGQQQRVAIARALAAEPRIMLMDEPFGALDPVTRDNLGRAYRALHDKLGLTTIMVTHDM
ncbi:MAG: ATP-binding cassette domain-containing protein, partial [Proteobacteria bacterium]|nr:ATP-binding cassette domain-containing protein [Pseudomonadota bacterium]